MPINYEAEQVATPDYQAAFDREDLETFTDTPTEEEIYEIDPTGDPEQKRHVPSLKRMQSFADYTAKHRFHLDLLHHIREASDDSTLYQSIKDLLSTVTKILPIAYRHYFFTHHLYHAAVYDATELEFTETAKLLINSGCGDYDKPNTSTPDHLKEVAILLCHYDLLDMINGADDERDLFATVADRLRKLMTIAPTEGQDSMTTDPTYQLCIQAAQKRGFSKTADLLIQVCPSDKMADSELLLTTSWAAILSCMTNRYLNHQDKQKMMALVIFPPINPRALHLAPGFEVARAEALPEEDFAVASLDVTTFFMHQIMSSYGLVSIYQYFLRKQYNHVLDLALNKHDLSPNCLLEQRCQDPKTGAPITRRRTPLQIAIATNNSEAFWLLVLAGASLAQFNTPEGKANLCQWLLVNPEYTLLSIAKMFTAVHNEKQLQVAREFTSFFFFELPMMQVMESQLKQFTVMLIGSELKDAHYAEQSYLAACCMLTLGIYNLPAHLLVCNAIKDCFQPGYVKKPLQEALFKTFDTCRLWAEVTQCTLDNHPESTQAFKQHLMQPKKYLWIQQQLSTDEFAPYSQHLLQNLKSLHHFDKKAMASMLKSIDQPRLAEVIEHSRQPSN